VNDWISVYGNSTSGYNVADMTPRRWSGAPTVKPTSKPSSKPIANTYSPTTTKTSKPTANPSLKPTSFPTSAPTVFVNEVADKGDYTVCGGSQGAAGRDWVELYNSADVAVDLSGWKLHDDRGPSNSEAYVFPAGSVLSSNSYTIFCQADTFIFGIGRYVMYY
jgi:hypothetical protein